MALTMKRGIGGWYRRIATTTSVGSRVPLAFDLHEPPQAAKSSKAIIIMHGLFGSKKNNRSISKALAQSLGRPIYAIDLRNHGESPHHPQHDYLSMAEDLAGFITTHNLEAPSLIGHSMGAKAAMVLALRYPSLVQDIVSVDNVPAKNSFESDFTRYITGMKKVEESGVLRISDADVILRDYTRSLLVRQFLLGNLYIAQDKTRKFRPPLAIINQSLDHLQEFPLVASDSCKFLKPALFVRGTQSQYISDDSLSEVEKFFPHYKIVDIDAGHWVISEKPDEFKRIIDEFLG